MGAEVLLLKMESRSNVREECFKARKQANATKEIGVSKVTAPLIFTSLNSLLKILCSFASFDLQ